MNPRPDGDDTDAVDPRLARTQWRMARAVLGDEAVASTVEDATFDPQLTGEVATAARRARTLAEFADRIASGTPLDEAAVDAIRVLAGQERPTARGLALGLEGAGCPGLPAIGLGLVSMAAGERAQAWGFFAEAALPDLARLVPVEAVGSGLAAGTPEAASAAVEIGRIVAGEPKAHGATVFAELAGRLLVAGHRDLALDLVRHAASARSAAATPDDRARALLDNLDRWLDPLPEPETTGVRLGVIDYPQPDYDHASRNVGDYVQTLAMLGNLARFPGVRFHGADGLGDLIGEIQSRVRPELRHTGERAATTEGADVTVLPVSRDYSPGEQVPPNTWLLAFGWHMHPVFNLGFGLPYHPNIRPVFISFHLNRVGALTPETIDYLRENGPVGCRDWTTVDILLSAGVDAFFTGCVTTTVDAVFPPIAEVDRSGADLVAAIDLPAKQVRQIKQPHVTVTHHGLEHRRPASCPGSGRPPDC